MFSTKISLSEPMFPSKISLSVPMFPTKISLSEPMFPTKISLSEPTILARVNLTDAFLLIFSITVNLITCLGFLLNTQTKKKCPIFMVLYCLIQLRCRNQNKTKMFIKRRTHKNGKLLYFYLLILKSY